MLIVILLNSFNSFSQKIIPNKAVILTEKQAKAVAVDLVKGVACAEELDQTNAILEVMETKVAIKDKVIDNLEKQKVVLLEKDSVREKQIKAQEVIIENTERQVKSSNKKTTFYKIIGIAGLITSLTLLIAK